MKAYATTTVHRRPKDGTPGADGDGAPSLVIAPSALFVPAKSDGSADGAFSKDTTIALFVGGSQATITTALTKSKPSIYLTVTCTVADGVATARAVVSSGTPSNMYEGTIVVTITGTYNGKTFTIDGSLPVTGVKQGAQGIQGIQGQMLRKRGRITTTTTDTIYNNDSWVDWVIYGTGASSKKYHLAPGVTEWTKDYYIKNGTRITTSSPRMPQVSGTATTDGVWTVFSEISDLTTSLMLTDSLYSETANIVEAFIGETSDGITPNEDGSMAVGSTANGWAINKGRIWHTKTGLELTKDGYLNDPNGLHLKVGGDASNAILPAKPNLMDDAIFCNDLGFDDVELEETDPQGTTSSTAGIFQSASSNSPWYNDGGKEIIMYVEAASVTSAYNLRAATFSEYTAVTQGNTYTFSAWVQFSGQSEESTLNESSPVIQIALWTSRISTTPTYLYLRIDNVAGTLCGWKQVFLSFTVPSGYRFLTWRPCINVAYGTGKIWSNFAMFYAGVKLEAGDTPTPMSFGIKTSLLPTGIDILNRKIILTADMLLCRNNSGQSTAWLDEVGNFTIAGVLNNLLVTINKDNVSDYGYATTSTFYLNPLKCPSVISYLTLGTDAAPTAISLPLAYWDGNGTVIEGQKSALEEFTLDELRQCIGKTFYFLSEGSDNSRLNFIAGNANMFMLAHVTTKYGDTVGLPHVTSQVLGCPKTISVDFEQQIQPSSGYHPVKATCVMGMYDGHECIYWEIEMMGETLPDP